MGQLLAGASKTDLRPPIGSWLSGFGGRISASTARHDPNMVKALVLSDGATTVALASCDLIGFDAPDVRQMREDVEALCGVPAGNVMIACTHTHSGPCSMPLRGVMGRTDPSWLESTKQRVAQTIVEAHAALHPASASIASGQVCGFGFNRQDGGGPLNERLDVASVWSGDGSPMAFVARYACHPVILGQDNLNLSADYPGYFASSLEANGYPVALWLQGSCGDVDPIVNRERGWGAGTFDDAKVAGERIAQEALRVAGSGPGRRSLDIACRTALAELPLGPAPSPEELAELVSTLKQAQADSRAPSDRVAADAMVEWVQELESAMRDGTLPSSLEVEVQVAAIGNVRIVGLPFETYTEVGLAIEAALAPHPTWVVCYANGLYGYCATDAARKVGGYGPVGSHRWFPRLLTPLGFGADTALVEAVKSASADLHMVG